MGFTVAAMTLSANPANRFFSLDDDAEFLHTIFSSEAC